ncbi:CBS domain-containing protein [Bradyrhizobium ivorense]|uniref:CBS domain-containing protein n=1 Tax=Bradyrhizobium ivorense TaxID=2511166 RepID=UPI0010BB3BC1|nr:CBS domain-containing protein [Bradyrhizobium ivorense]VIO71978.1 Hypoxic response protein 1 [Bradyrhizobium ivorense]
MHVADILRNKSQRTVAIAWNETVGVAAGLMRASNVGALVVRNAAEAVIGMFSERDVVAVIAERGATGLSSKVSQFISARPLVCCRSQDRLAYVERLMIHHQIRHVPAIDNGRLVGVVSERDIAFASDGAGAVRAA